MLESKKETKKESKFSKEAAKTKEVAGARIENKEIIIKGEEAPAAEEVVEAPAEVAETVEAPVAESTENKAE